MAYNIEEYRLDPMTHDVLGVVFQNLGAIRHSAPTYPDPTDRIFHQRPMQRSTPNFRHLRQRLSHNNLVRGEVSANWSEFFQARDHQVKIAVIDGLVFAARSQIPFVDIYLISTEPKDNTKFARRHKVRADLVAARNYEDPLLVNPVNNVAMPLVQTAAPLPPATPGGAPGRPLHLYDYTPFALHPAVFTFTAQEMQRLDHQIAILRQMQKTVDAPQVLENLHYGGTPFDSRVRSSYAHPG